MAEKHDDGVWQPSSDRAERVKELSLSPEDFAALTGVNVGFSPAHPKQWMKFWQQDICQNDQFPTCFPRLSLAEARCMWLLFEEHFFARYEYFLRVWPEWGSSGIWAPPYPGSRAAGGTVDYPYLPLATELVERFKAWQADYDNHEPWAPEKFDWHRHAEIGGGLARDLKISVGASVYVEHRELLEVLNDGTTRPWRPVLGLPESV